MINEVVHIDGTARVQTVSIDDNPLYYRLLKNLKKLSGHSVVINTSSNVRSHPMVDDPNQAISCFYSSGLDALIIGNYLIEKNLLKKLSIIIPCYQNEDNISSFDLLSWTFITIATGLNAARISFFDCFIYTVLSGSFISVTVIAEYISRTLEAARKRPPFVVDKILH